MEDKKIYLIDGHALVYRAYFAFIRNPLTNSQGIQTSAVFGFANYLFKLLESYNCPYIAVVLDSSAPTFRHDAYSEYKANREAMPDELKLQIPLVNRLIEAINIPVVKKDGLEADDLIAALTHKAVADGFEVFLVTRDKDLMQLVGPQVTMLAPEGTGVLEKFGVDEVIAKMGVIPEKIVDFLALVGDSSDNIPGVPGIGPKNAIKIIELAGSVKNLLENPSVLKNPKLIQKIEENRERLEMSYQLATLKCDDCNGFELEDLKRKPIDRTKCVELFREMDFTSLLKNPLLGAAPKSEHTVQILTTTTEITSLVEKIQSSGFVALHIVGDSTVMRSSKIVGIALALQKSTGFYIPFCHDGQECVDSNDALQLLSPVFESAEIKKTGFNLKNEYQILKSYQIQLQGIDFDAMIAAYLIEPGKRNYELDMLAPEFLNIEIPKLEILTGKNKNEIPFTTVPIDQAAHYAVTVTIAPLLLKEMLDPKLEEEKLVTLFKSIEIPLLTVLAELEWAGIEVDRQLLATMSSEYTGQLNKLTKEIYDLAGESFNLNSPKQIGEVFFDRLQLPKPKKTKTGGHSTNVDVLEKLAPQYPIVQKLLEYRELQKLLSTYIDALPEQILEKTGRVHSSFNQTIAATGRLSSTNPNLQNIPIRSDTGKKIREAFVASKEMVLVCADYSQIELRILAHLSDDHFLKQAFIDDKDIHTQTASAIYGVFPEMVTPEMRRAAKTINFGLMYGMGPINLSRQLGISFGEAKTFIETYFLQFPTIKEFMESTIINARELGYVETLLGRRRYLPEINASNRVVREAAERTAINTPVQGTAADIIKIAMIEIQKKMGEISSSARMLLQVHDELVFEVPINDADSFKQWAVTQMCNAYSFTVPLKVDAGIGPNWSVAH